MYAPYSFHLQHFSIFCIFCTSAIIYVCVATLPDMPCLICDFCPSDQRFAIRLPSDSTSRWTPLSLAVSFPLLGHFTDLHRLDYAHAGRTTKLPIRNSSYRQSFYNFLTFAWLLKPLLFNIFL